ncbi:MAG: twin-arginine translocase TatA/TatE family subunit [Pseudomonadota bacterium]
MIGGLGFQELLVILVIVLIIFGAGKLPSVGTSLGKAIKGFKSSMADETPAEQVTQGQEGQPPAAEQPAGQANHASQGKPPA